MKGNQALVHNDQTQYPCAYDVMCNIILWVSELESNQWKCRWWNKREKRNGKVVKAGCDRCEEGNE